MRHDGGVTSDKVVGVPDAGGKEAVTAQPQGSVIVELDETTRAVALREAIVEAGDASEVGGLVDAHREADDVVTARFAAAVEGYHGWQWSVTLCVLDPAAPTVSEVVLLPGPAALLAPEWVPWKQRVRGGDLGVGDLLPPAPDDARIVPAYVQSDDPAVEDVAHELGVGRTRVLSRFGREVAAERWYGGDFGPGSEMAKHAPAACATCAFFAPLAGSLGARFGVCTNEFSPADGHVVDAEFGCGAHSETTVHRRAASATGDNVVDEWRLDVFTRQDAAGDAVAGEAAADEAGGEAAEDASDVVEVDEAALDGAAAPTGDAGA